ncbi:MAG: nickel pincer cofactor biosynthesis protein LarC [Candidatus Hermodarchaeota archaeon]
MRILYIDLNNSGISGDMFLASLLGLIPEPNKILTQLQNLKNFLSNISKLDIELISTEFTGIQLKKLKIEIKETKNNRTAKTLEKSLNDFLATCQISDLAKNYANKVLKSLIQAEIEVHGDLSKNIHLHELSSVDTLIDIIGTAIVLDMIHGFDKNLRIFCSKIPLGGGKVNIKHGSLAVPAPATLKILEKSNLITFGGPIDSELVTPTGAALLANLELEVVQFPPEMKILKSVYSTGQKKFKNFLNILRILYGEYKNLNYIDSNHVLQKYIQQISILETDVDDISGEILGNFIKELEKEEILDIQICPSITKKNRPGYVIKVLCFPEYTFQLIEKIMLELGTLGVRFNIIDRVCIDRKIKKTNITIYEKVYEINYKISFIRSEKGTKIVNIKPEYEDLKKISEETGLTVKMVQIIAQKEINKNYNQL